MNTTTNHLLATLSLTALLGSLIACGGLSQDNNDDNTTTPTDTSKAQLLACEDFGEDLTLTDEIDDGVDYIVDCQVGSRGELVVEPGVVIQFKPGASLIATGAGSIVAKGTAAKPIVFTGEVQEKGSWGGISILSQSPKNEFDHVTVEYGGGEEFGYDNIAAGLVVDRVANLELRNSTIRESKSYGFYHNGNFIEFEKNTITGSELAPAVIPAWSLHELDVESDLTGNGQDHVLILDGSRPKTAVTWEALSVPYLFRASTILSSDGIVTIAPGATLMFANNTGLSLLGQSIVAKGTEAAPITFKGETEEKGAWLGIHNTGSNAPNVFDHVVISHAGGSGGFGYENKEAALVIENLGKLELTNSTITHSAGYGLHGYDLGELMFANNTITECELEPVAVPSELAYEIDIDSDLTGNGRDYVLVNAELTVKDFSSTWKNLSVPYLIPAGEVLELRGRTKLILEAGTEVAFGEDAGLSVVSGSLQAKGTELSRVKFFGEKDTAESWRGLYIGTSDPLNKLEYTTIRNAGGTAIYDDGERGAIVVDTPAQVTLDQVDLEESGTCGVNLIDKGSKAIIDGTSYEAADESGMCVGS